MKTVSHWIALLPMLGMSLAYYMGLGWAREARRVANLAECGHPPKARRESDGERDIRREQEADCRPACPDEDWCPAHDTWFGPETECPGCREEWEQTWTLGEDPEAIAARDDWNTAAMEAWIAGRAIPEDGPEARYEDVRAWEFQRLLAEDGRADGWYNDLVNRAGHPGNDPHSGWRD